MASFSLTIPDDKVDEFTEKFLAVKPIETDPETDQPLYTSTQWIKMCFRTYGLGMYRQGKKLLATQEIEYDNDIIQE